MTSLPSFAHGPGFHLNRLGVGQTFEDLGRILCWPPSGDSLHHQKSPYTWISSGDSNFVGWTNL